VISAAIIEVKRDGRNRIDLNNYKVFARWDGDFRTADHPPPYPTLCEARGIYVSLCTYFRAKHFFLKLNNIKN